jgi:hypothetical protein
MASSLLLLVSVVMAFAGGDGPWIIVVTVAIATIAGTRLPDLDTRLRLRHRSALLHGVLPPVLALADGRTRGVAAGLALGIGLHLSADLFPGRMRGFATIKLPGWGSLGAKTSYLWIGANAAANLLGGAILVDQIVDRRTMAAMVGAIGVIGVTYLVRADGGLWALTLFAMIGWLAFR